METQSTYTLFFRTEDGNFTAETAHGRFRKSVHVAGSVVTTLYFDGEGVITEVTMDGRTFLHVPDGERLPHPDLFLHAVKGSLTNRVED